MVGAQHRHTPQDDANTRAALWRSIQAMPKNSDGSITLPPVSALSESYSRANNWIGGVLKSWVKDKKIQHWTTGAGRALKHHVRLNGTEQPMPPPVEQAVQPWQFEEEAKSKKNELLELLKAQATEKGIVGVGADWLRRRLGLGMHDLHKFLFDLKAQGLIELRMHHGEITAIRVRPLGTVPASLRLPESDEKLIGVTGEQVDAEAPVILESAEPGEAPVEFPLISRLLKRQSKILEASQLLLDVGLEEESLALVAKADEMSPLEAEIMKLVESKGLSGSFH